MNDTNIQMSTNNHICMYKKTTSPVSSFRRKWPLTKFMVQNNTKVKARFVVLIPNVRNTYNPNIWKQTIRIKTERFRISYYLQPLVFDFMILTICCKSWLFQTLISHRRWCSTEEENKIRNEFRDQNHILRAVASHQNHVVALPPLQSSCGSRS